MLLFRIRITVFALLCHYFISHDSVARAEVEGVVRYPTSADARSRNLELAVQLLKQDGVNIQPAEAVRGKKSFF